MNSFVYPVSIQTIPYITPLVQIHYPQVEKFNNYQVQVLVNQTIQKQVRDLIQEQEKYQVQGYTEMTGTYEIKTNERLVLSLTQTNYAYTPPMAHGMTILKGLTFDMNTGKAYTLKDLFKPGSDYVKRISEIIKVQIKTRNITLLEEFKQIRPDQDFYIADKSLVVFFQLYEITPYAAGFPMFPISVYELEDIINENSPLGRMLPSN